MGAPKGNRNAAKGPRKMTFVGIRLPAIQVKRYRQIAAETGCSLSTILRVRLGQGDMYASGKAVLKGAEEEGKKS